MKTYKKIALALSLFLGLAVFSYGDTYYSFGIGYYRFSDVFSDEDFGRNQNGIDLNLNFFYIPQKLPLGFFVRTSVGILGSGYEWQGDEKLMSFDDISVTAVRLGFGPSYLFKLSNKASIPLSLGPVVGIYQEGNYSSKDKKDGYYYEAFNLGIMGDAAIIFNISPKFFIMQGFGLEWLFLHMERGEMKTNYRSALNTRFSKTPYSAFGLSIYLGCGIYFY